MHFVPALLLMLMALTSHAQSPPPSLDRVESIVLPALAGGDWSPLKPRSANAAPSPNLISIGHVALEKSAAETSTAPRPGTPRKIGFGRDIAELASPADTAIRLQWQTTPQGAKSAALSVTSPLATGIRLGVLVRRLPAEAGLRFYRQGAGEAYEFTGAEVLGIIHRNLDAGDRSDEARTFWSPYFESEEATLEIELPNGIGPDTVEIAIPRVSHFYASPIAAPGGEIEKIGQAASCEIDVSCYGDWSNESKSAAKMTFVDSGTAYECSGTLLNNKAADFTPYFLSANHCISSQTVASTLQTYWFYRSASCNSGVLNSAYQTRPGGATLLYTSAVTDTTFMRLNNNPPTGVFFAGWDPNAPSLGAAATGLHHPKGDLQKISIGSLKAYTDCSTINPVSDTFSCITSNQASGEFLNVVYTLGTTEPGSSGSGLFSTNGTSRYLIGQLRGGSSSCANPGGSNEYGRFDIAYVTALNRWLDASSAASASGGIMTSFASRGTVSSTTSMYGSFAVANTSVMYIAVRGPSLGTLGFTNNPLDLPNLRLYDSAGKDALGSVATGCTVGSTVSGYYAGTGGALDTRDTCVSKTLAAGVYTFMINPNGSSAAGELLFEVRVNPASTIPGGYMTSFASRGNVTPTAPMYGSFAITNTSVTYIAVRGPSLGTLGFTNNPLDLPNLRVYDASGKDALGSVATGCVGGSTVSNYYASTGGALNARDTCLSATLAAGVYTFTISPNTAYSYGELLFEVRVNP